MSLLSFVRKEELVTLLLDIGNGTITCALVLFTKNNTPKFLYSTKLPFVINERADVSRMLESMNTILDLILLTCMKEGFVDDYWKSKSKKIDEAMISFSAPWFTLKTKHIHITNEQPFLITKNFLQDIVSKEEAVFQKELSGESTEKNTDNFKIIEKSIVNTKINGYTLANSIGNKTKMFDVYLCMSAVSSGIMLKIEKIILKHTHIPQTKILTHSFPLISFTVIRDVFGVESDFALVDITSEVLDITIIKDGTIRESVSIPFGRNYIIRKIAKVFAVSMEIAESTLRMYTAKKADDSVNIHMRDIIVDIEKEMSENLLEVTKKSDNQIIIPSIIYVTAEKDITDLNLNFLKLPNSTVTYISSDKFKNNYQTPVAFDPDGFIIMLSIFYDKFFKQTL